MEAFQAHSPGTGAGSQLFPVPQSVQRGESVHGPFLYWDRSPGLEQRLFLDTSQKGLLLYRHSAES